MNIELLADHPGVLTTLADWYVREWAPYYGTDGPGDARADLEARSSRHAVPIGLVALEGDEVQGAVGLDRDVATGLTPSVVGLLVAGQYRGRGVAAALLDSATQLAGQLGHERVYTSTSVLGGHLLRNGWRLFDEARFLNHEQGFVYARDLRGAAP